MSVTSLGYLREVTARDTTQDGPSYTYLTLWSDLGSTASGVISYDNLQELQRRIAERIQEIESRREA
jgi:hypothetical protein